MFRVGGTKWLQSRINTLTYHPTHVKLRTGHTLKSIKELIFLNPKNNVQVSNYIYIHIIVSFNSFA